MARDTSYILTQDNRLQASSGNKISSSQPTSTAHQHKPFKYTNLNTFTLLLVSINLLATIQVVCGQSQSTAPEEVVPRGPHFAALEDEPVQYIQVGRSVKFKCVVKNLGKHKVAWFHKEKREHLAVDNRTLLWRDRLHAWTPAPGVFELHIEQVQLADMGNYTCQLTTKPPQSQVHALSVLVPPQINEHETTVSIEPVKEFGVAELRCVANGVPKPVIKWRRESQTYKLEAPVVELEQDVESSEAGDDSAEPGVNELDAQDATSYKRPPKQPPASSLALTLHQRRVRREPAAAGNQLMPLLESDNETTLPAMTQSHQPQPHQQQTTAAANSNNNNNNNKQFIAEGEVFRIERVTRHHMGFYLCLASNGVGSSVSQRIFLPVSYSQQAHRATTSHLSKQQAAQPDPGSPQAGTGSAPTSRPAKGNRLRADWQPPPLRPAKPHKSHPTTTTTTGSSPWSSNSNGNSTARLASSRAHLLLLVSLLSCQLLFLLLLGSVQIRVLAS